MIIVGLRRRPSARRRVDVEWCEARLARGAGGEQFELDDVPVGIEPHHRAGDTEVGREDDACPLGEEVERGHEMGGIVDLPSDVCHPHLVPRVGGVDVGVLVQGEVAVTVRAGKAEERELVLDVLGDHFCAEQVGVELDRALPIGDIEGDVVERDRDHGWCPFGERRPVRRSMPTMRGAGPAVDPRQLGCCHPPEGWDGARDDRLRRCRVWSDLRAERVARELAGLAARELQTCDLLCAVDELVDQVVPADASCWSTFDPATTMLTSAVGRNIDEDSSDAVRFMELEYVTQAPGHYRG